MLWTIEGAIFLAIFSLTYGLAISWTSRARVKVRASDPGTRPQPTRVADKRSSRLKEWSVEWLASSGKWALPDMDKVSEMRKTLIQAGIRHPQAPAAYLALRGLTAFILPLPVLLVYIVRGKMNASALLVALGLSVVGFYLPAFIVGLKIKRRQERLDRALPDILDMFVIAMDAGLSLNAALHRVVDEIHGLFHDFFEEMQIAAHELRNGITWDEAFDNLAKRTGVQSIRSMVSLMIQSGRLGGSIGDALRHHGEFTRTQRLLRAEEKAAKLPVKMIFPMLFCIFPAIVIVVVGPGIIHMIDSFIKSGLLNSGKNIFGGF